MRHLNKIEIDFTPCEINPEVLQLLTGGFQPDGLRRGVTLYIPIRRTFWQWLRRKPVQKRVIHMPNVIIESPDIEVF